MTEELDHLVAVSDLVIQLAVEDTDMLVTKTKDGIEIRLFGGDTLRLSRSEARYFVQFIERVTREP